MADLMTMMTTDVNVGMNEVVSVFVAKYEDGLFAKKDDLSSQIKTVKKNITDLEEDLQNSVDQNQYVASIPALGISTAVDSVNVLYDGYYKNKKPVIQVNVGVYDADSDRSYANYTKTIYIDIPKDSVNLNISLKKELEGLNAELMEVMGLIKSVSRKERQIRGKISEMKLEQSGFAELMENPEMLKLVKLD